jgi:hypothetical protein
MILLPEGLKALKRVAKEVGLDLKGAYELVASFVNRSNLLKWWEKTDVCEGSAGGVRRPKNAAFTRIPIPSSATECHAFF